VSGNFLPETSVLCFHLQKSSAEQTNGHFHLQKSSAEQTNGHFKK